MSVTVVRAPTGWLGPGRLVDDVTVVIDRGLVVYAGPAAGAPSLPEPDEEIAVDGFIMPGVVDRHVHMGFAEPRAVLAGGVTAVRDLGWPPGIIHPLAERSQAPGFEGPLIRAVGPIVTCRGGYPARAGWAPSGTAREVHGVSEAAAVVEEVLAAAGAAVVKIALNSDAGPVLRDDELAAICEAAHGSGAIVTAHVQGLGQAARAVEVGVDEFAHCPWSESLPDDLLETAARRMRIVSTLDIQSFGRDTPELRTAIDNLARFVRAGGRVAYGTDLGNGSVPPGIDVREANHLRAAGLAPDAVLEAMTFRPLAPGEPGDLVVLAGSPSEDLDALGRVALVVRGGRPLR